MTINDLVNQSEVTFIQGAVFTIPNRIRRENVRNCRIVGENKYTSIIKRPDFSIGLNGGTDDNYGLFLQPAPPTQEEIDNAYWNLTSTPYGVLVRGEVSFENLTIDCNMQNQNIPKDVNGNVIKSQIEHSCMLGVRGTFYNVTRTDGVSGKLYIAFQSVDFNNIVILNRGYADAIWISRGYFRPSIKDLTLSNIESYQNVNGHRADIGFSGLVENSSFKNIRVDKIEAESDDSWATSPGLSEFIPALVTMSDVRMKRLDFASKANSLNLVWNNVRTVDESYFYQTTGKVSNSTFVVSSTDLRRMNRLKGMTFENCIFYIKPHNGEVRGLRPEALFEESCDIKFDRCTFLAVGNFTKGRLIETEKTNSVNQKINLVFDNCKFDSRFGVMPNTYIAILKEKGDVYFIKCGDVQNKIITTNGLTNLIII